MKTTFIYAFLFILLNPLSFTVKAAEKISYEFCQRLAQNLKLLGIAYAHRLCRITRLLVGDHRVLIAKGFH